MSMPFYVSPEQIMKDKADYARKGIARGRSRSSCCSTTTASLFVAENPSRALHKISEIYDRIAFAGVGKYNEFENLRVAGVRLADLRGYSYDREDVTGRSLANAYAQTLGTIFTETMKPYEVEIVVAEVGDDAAERPDLPPHLRRLGRPTSTASSAMGGRAEAIVDRAGGRRTQDGLGRSARPSRLAVEALAAARRSSEHSSPRQHRGRRCSTGRAAAPHVPTARGRRARAARRRLELDAPPTGPCDSQHGPAHLRDRERVRRHLHVPRPAPPVSPDEVARYLFRRVVSLGPQLATCSCANGARLYLDVGCHPEYATPECDALDELVTHDKAGERILEGLLVDAEQRLREEGIARRHLPVQEQHRLGRQLLRLPRELPGRPARASSRGSPTCSSRSSSPARSICGAGKVLQTPRGARLLRQPARRAHLGGRLVSATTRVAADHQHPRRAARRRRALPPAARHRRRLEHERDHDAAQGRRRRPGAADARGGRRDARPDAGEPDPGDPRDQPRPHRPPHGAAGQRPRASARCDIQREYFEQAARLRRPPRASTTRSTQQVARPVGAHARRRRDRRPRAGRRARSTGSSSTS